MSSYQDNLELGRARLGQGDLVGALTSADAALALDAESIDALQLRSRALFLMGRDVEALDTLRIAHAALHRELPPGQQDYENEETEQGDLSDDMQPVTETLDTLLALRERFAFDSDLTMMLAEVAEDAGRFELARENYEALLEMEPQRLEVWEGLIHVVSYDNLDEALAICRRAVELFPTHPFFYEFIGYIKFRRRQFRQAFAAYKQAIEFGADQVDNHQALIQCQLEFGNFGEAMQMTEYAVSRLPNDVGMRRFAIDISLECGDYDAAMLHAHHVLRMQPSHPDSYSDKALIELAQDDWDACERTLRLGFHKALDGIYCLCELVEVLIGNGEPDTALRVADLACELAPEHPEANASRGKALRELDDLPDALAAFRRAAEFAPQDDLYRTWVGVILDNMGEHREAIAHFNSVLSVHPTDVWTLANRGLSYMAQGWYEQAFADFTAGMNIDPQDAPLYFWRACLYAQWQEKEAALRDLRRALDLSDEIYPWMENEPLLDPLRGDPRFRELTRQWEDEEDEL